MFRKKNLLFDDEDENNEEANLNLNKDYATNYENWRRKEELNKSKAKYGDNLDDDNESSSSSDDEDDLEDEVLDTNFFQALSYLKNNDPRIYDQNVKFFDPPKEKQESKKKKDKPMFLRDYERKVLLETGGKVEESDEEQEEENPRAHSPTYVEEQRRLKENLSKLVKDDKDSDDEENWGGMFKKREKTKEELAKEEDSYLQWLKGQKETLQDDQMENELKPLKEYWGNPKLDAGEKFLRDYILNKKFIKDDDESYIPSYEEIIHDSDDGLSEDEQAIRNQEEFETKYNYRFEEPDQEFIKRYPRTMENSVRKKDDRRKEKRAEVRQRKEEEKLRKKEDLQQLKALKRKEIEEKLAKLKEITGNDQLGFNDDDVDGDFDPDEHDRRMQQLFTDEFYQGEEGDQKPVFNDLDDDLDVENWDQWQGETEDQNYESGPHCEDEDFNMDCDYDPSTSHAAEMIENSGGRRKRKRKSKFAEAVSKRKPAFNPNDKTYQEYLDEYYKLDYEDIIDDIPCRFKYRKVVPNDFGLSVEEILAAKDKELNKWCSLKKAIQIRPDHVENYDLIAFRKKGENEMLKKKLLPSLFGQSEEETPDPGFSRNEVENKTNKKKQKLENNIKGEKVELQFDTAEIPKSDSRKNEKQKIETETSSTEFDSHLNINNGNKTKKKENQKSSKEVNPDLSIDNNKNKSKNIDKEDIDIGLNTSNNENKSKKKKKHQQTSNEENSGLAKTEGETKIKKKKCEMDTSSEFKKNSKKRKHSENGNFKQKSKKFKKGDKNIDIGISDARLKAYGIKPKKFKNKLKYGNENS